jgi:RNA polymerase sigma-70 factor (ECF subfamily)
MKLDSKNEKYLLDVIRNGRKKISDEAFKELHDRYASRVFAYTYKILGEREIAEDIYQETFLSFYKYAKKNEVNSIIAFLIQTARNLCLAKKRDRKTKIEFEDFINPTWDEHSFEKEELNDLILKSLELLNEKYKEALVLKVYSGLDYKQIGEILEISQTNARTRVKRAKEQLREFLKPYINDLNQTG